MDGLLSPCSSAASVLRVPYFGSATRAEAHLQRTWDTEPPTTLDIYEILQQLEPNEQAAYIQSHLFFGLLIRQFFDGLLSEEELIAADGHHDRVITIRPLVISQAVLRWNAKLASLGLEQQERSFQTFGESLDNAETQCDQIDYPVTSDSFSQEWRNYGAVLLSIRLLLDFLRSVLETAEKAYLMAGKQSSRNGYNSTQPLHKKGYFELTALAKRRPITRPLPPGGRITMTTCVILDLFNQSGWCPVQAFRICNRRSYAEAVSLSRIKQEKTANNHGRCSSQGRCVAFDLTKHEMDEYSENHAHQHDCCAKCGAMGGSLTPELHRIIEAGRIPLMSIDPRKSDLDLRITENDGTRPYTAISHVWSDGLGNPTSNELQRCKLASLSNILCNTKHNREMNKPALERFYTRFENIIVFPRSRKRLYFWIDTFCIPTDPTRADLRRMAMRHITPIFQGADEVVILDADLQRYKPKKPESDWDVSFKEDMVAHVLASKWITRAWTLEEGALARQCQVQLAGNIVQLDQNTRREHDWFSIQVGKIWKREIDINRIVGSPLSSISLKPILADALDEYRKQAVRSGHRADMQRGRKNFEKTRSPRFVSAWNELLERSATRQEDRVLILGNILDFDAVALSALPAEARLPCIIESCHEVPLSLMFNTKLNSTETAHPNRAWLPTGIYGDRLVDSATIAIKVSEEPGQYTYSADLRDTICIRLDIPIPYNVRNFCITDAEDQPRFVFEVSPEDSLSIRAEQYYNAGCSTYLLIDPKSGTKSLNGYTGRGARFSVRASRDNTFLLGFDRPLTAWSMEQWRYKTGHKHRLPTYRESIRQATSNIVELEQAPMGHRRLLQRQPLHSKTYYGAWKRLMYIQTTHVILFTGFVLVITIQAIVHGATDDTSLTSYTQVGEGVAILAILLDWPILLLCWRWYKQIKYRRWVKSFLQASDVKGGIDGDSDGTVGQEV